MSNKANICSSRAIVKWSRDVAKKEANNSVFVVPTENKRQNEVRAKYKIREGRKNKKGRKPGKKTEKRRLVATRPAAPACECACPDS